MQRPPSNLTPYTQPRLQIQMQPQARTPINARAPLRTNPLMLGATANASPMSALSSPASIQQMQLQRRFQPPQQNTPFPIINQNAKNLFEKLVDYVIGEGPGSRYGMICKECHGHNGKKPFDNFLLQIVRFIQIFSSSRYGVGRRIWIFSI